jgi:hypothetical protein
MKKESATALIEALSRFFKPKPEIKPVAPLGGQPAGEKKPAQEPKKAVTPEKMQTAFVRASAKEGHLLTTPEKLSVLLDSGFLKTTGVRSQLVGCVSRLNSLDWTKASTDTWEQATTILTTEFTTPLDATEQIVFGEIKQAAAEYYIKHKTALEKQVAFEPNTQRPIFQNAEDRMRQDKFQYINEMAFSKSTARSAHPEYTAEWAKDIEYQTLYEKKHPDHLEITVEVDQVKEEYVKKRADPKYSWILEGVDDGALQNEAVAQVVHDIIAHPEPADNKEFLLVKGAQFKDIGIVGLDEQELKAMGKIRENFHKKLVEMYSKDPNFKQENMYLVENAVKEQGGKTNSSSDEVPIKVINSVKNSTEQGHEDVERYLKAFNIRIKSCKGDPRAVAEEFLELGKRIRTQDEFMTQLISNKNFAKYYEKLRVQVKDEAEKLGFIHEIERGWSYLYLSPELMKAAWRTPDELIMAMYDREAPTLYLGVFPDSVQESIKRNTEQVIQYVVHDDFRRHRQMYILNPANWPEINAITGSHINSEADAMGHKWFQEVKDDQSFKKFYTKLSAEIRKTGMLQQAFMGFQRDMEVNKLQDIFRNFGDEGYPTILNKRNGINLAVFELYKLKYQHVIWDENGNVRAINGNVMKAMHSDIVDFIEKHSALYEERFNEWDGSVMVDTDGNAVWDDSHKKIKRREFTRGEIEASVNEISFLLTVTGQRAQMYCNVETPFAMKHQWGNSVEFAAQPAEGRVLNATSPFRWVIERWCVENKYIHLMMRHMFEAEATRIGLDAYLDARFAGVAVGSDDFYRLAKYAYNIACDVSTPESRAANHESIKIMLSVVNQYTEDRGLLRKIFRREGAPRDNSPKTLDELTIQDIKDQIMYREGMRLLDMRFSGAYHYIDVGWQIQCQIDTLEDFGLYTKDNGVLLHEAAKMVVNEAMDVCGNHKTLHDKRYEQKDGLKEHTFVLMSRFDPISSFEALIKKCHIGAREWFGSNLNLLNVFNDTTLGEGPAYTVDRSDLFIKSASLRKNMIDTELASWRVKDTGGKYKPSPKGPIDYSKWTIGTTDVSTVYTKEEIDAMAKILKATGVVDTAGNGNVKAYLNAMKTTSDFAYREDIREDLSNPVFASHFLTVRHIDPRVQYLERDDLFKSVKGDTLKNRNWSGRVSDSPGGNAAGGGIVRYAGDMENSAKALIEHLQALLNAKDFKTFAAHLDPFVNTILYSGGQSTKLPTVQSMWYGWRGTVIRDGPLDWFGLGQNSYNPTSPAQRAIDTGSPSIERIELDHQEHEIEHIAGGSFHRDTPDFTHKMDVKNGIAAYVKIGKKHVRIPLIRLYNLFAWTLISGGVMAGGAVESGKKGAKQAAGGGGGDAGGGGGGGGGHAHP